MTLVRWTPARHTDRSPQTEFDQLVEGFFGGAGLDRQRRWSPAIDLVETEESFIVRADLPGMSEQDIELELTDNVLRVSGERIAESEEKVEGYHRFERSSGRFARTLSLPQGVDSDSISASFDRGVLEITIPKPEERKPRRIAIGTGAEALEAEGSEKDD